MGHAGIGVKAHKSWPIPLVADEMRVPIQIEHLVASARPALETGLLSPE